jgi:phage-related minor tail protein
MGEAGPEAIMPLSRGADGKLGVKTSGGGGISVVVQVVNQTSAPVQATQSGPAQFDGEKYIVGVVLSAVQNNPSVRNSLAGALR